MFQPDMFTDKVHDLHFIVYSPDGSLHTGDLVVTEATLGQIELEAKLLDSPTYQVWSYANGWEIYTDAR